MRRFVRPYVFYGRIQRFCAEDFMKNPCRIKSITVCAVYLPLIIHPEKLQCGFKGDWNARPNLLAENVLKVHKIFE